MKKVEGKKPAATKPPTNKAQAKPAAQEKSKTTGHAGSNHKGTSHPKKSNDSKQKNEEAKSIEENQEEFVEDQDADEQSQEVQETTKVVSRPASSKKSLAAPVELEVNSLMDKVFDNYNNKDCWPLVIDNETGSLLTAFKSKETISIVNGLEIQADPFRINLLDAIKSGKGILIGN